MMNGKKTAAKKPAAAKKTATKKYAMGGGVANTAAQFQQEQAMARDNRKAEPVELAKAAAQFQQQQSMAGGMMGQAPTAAQRQAAERAIQAEAASARAAAQQELQGRAASARAAAAMMRATNANNPTMNSRLARSVAVGRPRGGGGVGMTTMAKGGAVTKKPVATKGKKK